MYVTMYVTMSHEKPVVKYFQYSQSIPYNFFFIYEAFMESSMIKVYNMFNNDVYLTTDQVVHVAIFFLVCVIC